MRAQDWLNDAVRTLKKESVATAQLDAELLLADHFNRDRSWLHSHLEFTLQRSDLRKLDEQIKRRANHEPIAYIRGKQEFYGRDFEVSPDTLTPRPETETMVEMAIDLVENNTIQSVADIGAGSGCIVISLDLESKSGATMTGYEISDEALKIAEENAKRLESSATFHKTDITKQTTDWASRQLIVANLPYVPTDFKINTAATHEPDFAIFGGKDGLDYYRVMFEKLTDTAEFVLTESLPPQHKDLAGIAKKHGFEQEKTRDLIQLFTRK